MRGIYKVRGYYNDHKNDHFFEERDFQINVTIDRVGATMSVGDLQSEIQYTIPIDWLIREIKKGGL